MSDRVDLIERAAARLRMGTGDAAGTAASPIQSAAPGAISEALPPAVPAPPLTRQITLDRAYLARQGIVMPWTSTARIIEEFRIIKRNIMAGWQSSENQAGQAHPPRVVMVTSARPREGKTFSSINLALAFAAEEQLTTILIDADTVRGDSAKTLQFLPEPGLINVLSGELPLSDALIQTDIANLVILPSGSAGPQVPELLSSPAPGRLVNEIAERYPNHVIIMDTPPCLASTDPTALAAIAGLIVFVVEATHTQRPEVESALGLISGCSEINFLLNLVPVGTSEHFGSYSYYYQPSKQ